MQFKPILFSTEMVQAILEGRKTMTRREQKPQPTEKTVLCKNKDQYNELRKQFPEMSYTYCPYGEVGDVLYVREEHYAFGIWIKNGFTKRGRQKWKFKQTGIVYYNDTIPDGFKFYRSLAAHTKAGKGPDHASFYKRLARFMPKKYCRNFLQMKSIRVELLQNISEADAIAEGIEISISGNGRIVYRQYLKDKYGPSPIHSFETLWSKLNGLESWNANPWVWVIEFERVEKPENFSC